ncbi:unnamed protein product [Sphacelaria rigidula]
MSVMDQHVHGNGSDDCESNGGGGFTPIPDALRLPIHLLSDTLEDRNLAVASEVARSRGSLLDPSPEAAGGLRYSGMLRAARMYIASASMLSGLYFGFGFELLPPLVSGFTSLYTLVRSMSGYRTPILRGGLSIDGMISRGIVVVRAACIPWSLVYVALTERTIARVALVLTIVVECMTVIRNILKMKGFLGVDFRDSLRGKAEALEQVRREGASLPDLQALRERAQGVIPGCDDWAEERLYHCFGLYPKPLAIEGTGGSISYEGHTYEVISDGSTLLEWRQKRVYGTKPGIMISNCGATATTAWGGPVRVIPACAFSGDRRFGSTWLEMARALSSFVNTVLVVWLAFSSNTTHAVRLRPAAVGEFCAIALGVFGASDVDSSVTYRLLDPIGSSFTIGRGRHAAYRVASWAVMLGSLVGAGLVFKSEGATLGAAMTFVTPLAVALGAAFMGGANQYVALLGWYFGSVAYECSALVLILDDSPVAGLIALVGGVLADADLLRHFVLLTVIVEGLSGGNILLPKVSAGFAWRLGQYTSMLAVVGNRALSLPEVVDLGDVTTDLVPGKLTGDLEKMHTTERTSGKLSLFRRTGDAMYQERNCTVQSSGMGMCSPACVGGHIVPVLAAPHLRGVEVYMG